MNPRFETAVVERTMDFDVDSLALVVRIWFKGQEFPVAPDGGESSRYIVAMCEAFAKGFIGEPLNVRGKALAGFVAESVPGVAAVQVQWWSTGHQTVKEGIVIYCEWP